MTCSNAPDIILVQQTVEHILEHMLKPFKQAFTNLGIMFDYNLTW